ncbi:MAG: AAA family ATPase, partial [Deltaproteobacteria bacterium]|nr:AAA family ATPase [Deltaproteobacteria bacterium]
MKILHLRFKNLNSLEGEWAIDLTHPAFVLDGLFAITGPTGAGKSTILDAVCLALYGRTPRLNKVTKAGNEIMSRRTGECFAEVTFETQAGRFRCHWSQHRARKKPDGELQAPKHELADADSGRILETKILDVGKQIEKATGMDFDRFTRSMLLAQGGFTAFLQAPPDERAPILEQITGTEIYSRISIRVHERQREERDKLERLRAETAGIAMLEPEQEQGLQLELEAKLKEETDLARQVTDTGAAIGWLTAIEGLRKDIAGLAEEELRLQGRFEAFQPERDKLSRAIQAAALDGSHATLVTLRKQQAEDRAALKTGEAALPELASAAQKQAMALAGAEQQTAQAKEELKAAAPLIRQVRALDQRLAHQKQELAAGEKDCRKVLEKMAVDRRARLEEEGRRAEAAKNLELAEAYLRDQARDEWLIGGLAGVEEQAAGLLSKQQEIALKEAELNEAGRAFGLATQKLEEAATQSGLSKQNVEAASLKLQRGQEALDRLLGSRLLREYRAEQEALLRELAFLKTIAKLEDHRARLEDGKPCPLCGATEHPFALGQVPAADETEKRIEALARLIAQAEDQEAAIKKLEEAKTAAGQDLTESEKREAAAAHDKKAAGKTLAEVTASLEKLRAGLRDQRQALGAKLLGLGIPELPAADISSLLESLRARLTAWQAQVRKKAEFEHQLAGCDSAMKTLDAVLETQGQALAEKQERLAALRREFAAGGDERKRAYGDKDPDQEELRLNRAAAEAEKAEKVARERHSERLWKWHSAQAQVESLKKRLGEREAGLKKSEAEFIAALEAAGFRDEERFLKARLTPQQRN